MRSEKGEVTIHLIVGGIIFIVFIGICIFMLTGENGIFVPKRDKIQNNEITTNNTIDTNENDNTVNIEQNETKEENITSDENKENESIAE